MKQMLERTLLAEFQQFYLQDDRSEDVPWWRRHEESTRYSAVEKQTTGERLEARLRYPSGGPGTIIRRLRSTQVCRLATGPEPTRGRS
jgi:hypothetical protein